MRKIFLLCLLIQKSYASCPYTGSWAIDLKNKDSSVKVDIRDEKLFTKYDFKAKTVPLSGKNRLIIDDKCRSYGEFFFANADLVWGMGFAKSIAKIGSSIYFNNPIVDENKWQSISIRANVYFMFGRMPDSIGCSSSNVCSNNSRILVLSPNRLKVDVQISNKNFNLYGSMILYKK